MLKTKIWKFSTAELEYFEHIIKPGKLKIDHGHTRSLRKVLPPTNKSEMRLVLGMCTIYPRFVDNLTCNAGCLHTMLEKHSFKMVLPQRETISGLSTADHHNPCPAHPGTPSTRTFVFGWYRRISLWNQLFPPPNHFGGRSTHKLLLVRIRISRLENYSAPEREQHTIVCVIKILCSYLHHKEFLVHIDDDVLQLLLTFQKPSGRLSQWPHRLAEYSF